MTFLLTALAFIVIFSLLILIHEWGHFYTARKAGIKVEEFGFGIPPRIWGFKRGETLYSLNAIPFGGFVRVYGQDADDKKALKSKRSFVNKSARIRMLVVGAGILMNFLLSFVLLTFGFIVGIQPLIVSGEDVFENIQKGTIDLQQGILVKEVQLSSPAAQAGLQKGDFLFAVNGHFVISGEQIQILMKEKNLQPVTVEVFRKNKKYSLQIIPAEGKDIGFSVYQNLNLPRVFIHNVTKDSLAFRAGFRSGDMIVSINNAPLYNSQTLDEFRQNTEKLEFVVLRNAELKKLKLLLPLQEQIVISNVFSNTPAEKSGLQRGDVIVSIQKQSFFAPEQLTEFTRKMKNQQLTYEIRRGEEIQYFTIKPDQKGKIGISLSSLGSMQNIGMSYYDGDFPASITSIQNLQYPFWLAPVKAFEEVGRLTGMSVQMFGNLFSTLFTQFTVPDGVAGPVGIAQLTHVFVQEGFMSLVRFMALLSLSLAIINLLPIPALDGGRLFFIIIEVIIGRKVSARVEGIIHGIGFVFLMLLIGILTFHDVLRLF